MIILLDNFDGHITQRRMLPYWNKMGHTIVSSGKADVQLSNVRIGLSNRIPTVLRLDGIYYDTDTDFVGRNSSLRTSHQSADGIIYQSEYSRCMIEKYLGKANTPIYSVIYNGVNPDWAGRPTPHDGINITVTSKWRRHKRLNEIIGLFLAFHADYPNSNLHIFGMLHDNVEDRHKNIHYYGMVERDKMLKAIKQTDFSLHLSKRDSCPNSVSEYIGAGIPTITTNNCGGATEMCSMTPGCVVVQGDGNYNDIGPVPHYRDSWNVLSADLFSDILSAMKFLAENKTRVELPKELTAEYQAEQYIKILSEARDK